MVTNSMPGWIIRSVVGLVLGMLCALTQAQEKAAKGPVTITMAPGHTSYLDVSQRMVNEVVLPYENPQIISFLRETSSASIEESGSSVFVAMGNEEFIQLIVKDHDSPELPGISLTLMPAEDLPGQSIIIRSKGARSAASTAPANPGRESSLAVGEYEDMLRELMREAVRGKKIRGYTEVAEWSAGALEVGPVFGEGARRLQGRQLAIEYYILTNTGPLDVELVEPNFKQKGVRAIAFIDDVVLAPGQSSRMVWVRDR